MKRKLPLRIALCMALTLTLAVTMMPAAAFASTVQYLPDVTPEMSKASYWSKKTVDADKVLTSPVQIKALNQEIYKTSKETADLANWSQTSYNGIDQNAASEKSLWSDAEYFYSMGAGFIQDASGKWTHSDKEAVMEKVYAPMIANSQDPAATADMPVHYAICTNRTCMQGFPGDYPLMDEADDPNFDYLYHTMIRVNEPLILKSRSADGRYYLAIATGIRGWIPAQDVAICKDRDEWLQAWHSDNVLVVYDDKIYTEDSRVAPETANRKLPMGTRLILATDAEIQQGRIGNRTAHNNHVVWMPVRNEDGSFSRQLALIGENRKVSEGYLPLTTANILKVAMNQLGDTYGWGGMLSSEDCSGYMRDVYACFGLDMPRSTNRNNGVLKEWDLSKKSDAEKTSFLKTMPPGTVLAFSGHEMMYLGREGDKLYVISSVSNIRIPGEHNNTRVRGCAINTLDIWRASETTWLHNLSLAQIPYYPGSKAGSDGLIIDPPMVYENPMTAAGKDISLKASALKSKTRTVAAAKAFVVTDAKGKVTYKKTGGSKKISVAKDGTVKVRKGLASGTYKVKIKVTAKGTKKYKACTQTLTLNVKVK